LFEITKSICPDCRQVVDAQVLIKKDKVYMRKKCMQHGQFESLISSDASRYAESYKFNTPGLIPKEFGTKIEKGCPYDCGLCPDHEQHSCIGIIEVTNACNLRCPTCFAAAEGHDFLSLEEVSFMLDEFIKHEDNPEVVQFSGGEPTIHPQILEIIGRAREKEIKYVMLNTNGIRISMDDNFVERLARLNPVVYLQFDGFRKETYEKLRGENLIEAKLRAINNMEKHGIRIMLVATIQRGVNEDEVGKLVDFALSRKSIKGIVFQPTFYAGRHPEVDPLDMVTLPEVIKSISDQSANNLKNSDFVPTPCCYPTCNSSCYLYVDDNEVRPLARVVNVEEYLDYFTNRSIASLSEIKKSFKILNSSECCGSDSSASGMSCCGIPIDLKGIERNIKLIMIQSFMDPFNFDIKKLLKCCIHEITPAGKIVPICAFNNIPQYREEVNTYFRNKRTGHDNAKC
jgi:uncharacterized radical SAM superfamily Fe-S cluster-containing enzyme